MNINRMNLNLLVVLNTLLKERSVSKAADKLHLTQAAISNSLKQLREVFDDQLFIRQSKGITPTAKALAIAPKLDSALDSVQWLFVDEAFDPSRAKRQFNLALADHGAYVILPKLSQYLSIHAPNIKLIVRDDIAQLQQDYLSYSNIDMSITTQANNSAQVESHTLFSEAAVCIANNKHPIHTSEDIMQAYIEARHIAVYYNPHSAQSFVDRLFEQRKQQRNVLLSVPNITVALNIIEESDLVGTLPEILAKALVNNRSLECIATPFDVPKCNVNLYWHKRFSEDPAHQWLRQAIIEIAQSLEIQV